MRVWRHTRETILAILKTKGDYDIIGEYTGLESPLCIIHNVCGHQWTPASAKSVIYRFAGCPVCRTRKESKNRLTQEEFQQKVWDRLDNTYTVIGTYNGVNARVQIRHEVCGHEWNPHASNVAFVGTTCPICSHRIITTESYQKQLQEKYGKEYTLVSEYVDTFTPVSIRHNECGTIFSVTPKVWSNGEMGCPNCRRCGYTTIEGLRMKMDAAGITWADIIHYTHMRNRVVLQCKTCGAKVSLTKCSRIFSHHDKCYTCVKRPRLRSQSKGEVSIRNTLKALNVSHTEQYRIYFKSSPYHPCSYDFVIKRNQTVALLIEFDGKQHYEPVKSWGGEDTFKINQKRDRRKDLYAWVKGIPLLRIPYWEQKNIEQILTDKLRELGLLPSLLKQYEYMSKGPLFFEWAA